MDLFKAKSRHWCTVSKSANTKDTSRTGALYEGLNPQSSTSADAHSWEVHGLVAGKPPFTTGGRGSICDSRPALDIRPRAANSCRSPTETDRPESDRRNKLPQAALCGCPMIDEFDATKSQRRPIFIDRNLSNSIEAGLP